MVNKYILFFFSSYTLLTHQLLGMQSHNINSQKIKQETHNFLSNIFDKNFIKIKKDFHKQPLLVKQRILLACGEAKPFLLIAMSLPKDQQHEVIARQLDYDKKSADLFCSQSLGFSLNHYHKALAQADYYKYIASPSVNLPVGFHYRTSTHTCNLLVKAVKSTQRHSFLTQAEIEQLYDLFQNDRWIIEALNIKSQFLYQSLTIKDNVNMAAIAINHMNWAYILREAGVMLGICNGWIISTPIFLFLALIEYYQTGTHNLIKNFSKLVAYEWFPVSAKVIGGASTCFILCRFFKNYYANKYTLLERKKIYL